MKFDTFDFNNLENGDTLATKNRGTKVYITNEVINKVQYHNYPFCTEEQNKILQDYSRELLLISKEDNDSNEVSLVCSKNNIKDYEIVLGTENSVYPLGSPEADSILRRTNGECVIIVLHNHPNLSTTFSVDDINFFINYINVSTMSVISNLGKIESITKSDKYDRNKARELLLEYTKIQNQYTDFKNKNDICKELLKELQKIGIIYKR